MKIIEGNLELNEKKKLIKSIEEYVLNYGRLSIKSDMSIFFDTIKYNNQSLLDIFLIEDLDKINDEDDKDSLMIFHIKEVVSVINDFDFDDIEINKMLLIEILNSFFIADNNELNIIKENITILTDDDYSKVILEKQRNINYKKDCKLILKCYIYLVFGILFSLFILFSLYSRSIQK